MGKKILVYLIFIISIPSIAEKKIELKDLGTINTELIKPSEAQEKPIGTLTQPKIQITCTDKTGKLLKKEDIGYNECLNNIKGSSNKKGQSSSETGTFNIKLGD